MRSRLCKETLHALRFLLVDLKCEDDAAGLFTRHPTDPTRRNGAESADSNHYGNPNHY
jgi:hypothetical protein